MSWRRWLRFEAVQPLLVAAYPVLFLFAHNIQDQMTLQALWEPLLASLAGTAVALVALSMLLRNLRKGALLTSLGAVLFFGSGHVWNTLGDALGSQWLFLAAWLVLGAATAAVIMRGGGWLPSVSAAVTVVAGVGVALNAWTIFDHVTDPAREAYVADGAQASATAAAVSDLPDIYYIVPDRYANLATLRDAYGYDNSPFVEALEERGFYVANDAYANYFKTSFSLVSSLSMDYLDHEALQEEAESEDDRGPIHRRLRGELPVPHRLTELGYTYIHLTSWYYGTNTNVDADVVLRYDGQTEFSAALEQTTLLGTISPRQPIPDSANPWDPILSREYGAYQLARLMELPNLPGPKFVFAHMLIPHDPYVFDVDGTFMEPRQVAEQGHDESYLRQLRYLNDRLLEIVDNILAVSDEPPVIIIQSDEGPYPDRARGNRGDDYDWREATQAELEEKSGILHALHLPGVDPAAAGLYPSMSPVNTFRVVFNTYLDTDLPLLEDRAYGHPNQAHYNDIFEFTDRLTVAGQEVP